MSHRLPASKVPVSLRRLFPQASFVGCADIRVEDATERSQACRQGALFAAVPGTQCHGANFVQDAIDRGAAALLVEIPLPGVSVPQCVVPQVRKAYAELCNCLFGQPSQKLDLVGVTGTNGKTTVTWLVRSILRAAGRQTGLLGTIEYHDGVDCEAARLTTPDSLTLATWLSAMVCRHTTHAAMEVSSHALSQDRIAGTELAVGVLTNITQDHFDYHGDYESYLTCKARIAEHCRNGAPVVINLDDPGARRAREFMSKSVPIVTYSLTTDADVTAEVLCESLTGTHFLLNLYGAEREIRTSLIGHHNVSNALAAVAAAAHLGVSPADIQLGLESLTAVPGRLERVGSPDDAVQVFVDYAHTEDALRRCVEFLKTLTPGRLLCVFGAGGDRDRAKRPLMGRAASAADLVVVTSDNPRSEPPENILQDILAGLEDRPDQQLHVEVDRAEAIDWTLRQARPGDCIVIAGKGHETEQIIGQQAIPFDDRQVAAAALRGRTDLLTPPTPGTSPRMRA